MRFYLFIMLLLSSVLLRAQPAGKGSWPIWARPSPIPGRRSHFS